MKTSDFRNKPTSSQLKENMNKMFGVNVNLTKYSREQLEDMRNKLRTKVFHQEGKAGINDLLTNETYQKDKAMLALLNTRIKEMLGENLKQLKDKMIELSEAKKGVKAPKYKIHAKGTAGKDYDGDGKVETPKDEVWGSRAKAAAKSGKPFEEGKGSKPDFLDMDKDGNKKEPMKKAVADKKVKEAAKWRDAEHKGKLYTQEPDDGEGDRHDYYRDSRPENDPGEKRSTFNRNKDTDKLHYPYGDYQVGQKAQVGDRAKKGLLTKNAISVVKNRIKGTQGDHPTPNLPEGFPTVDDAKKAHAEKGTASMKTGEKKKTSSGGEVTKTATGTVHKAGAKGYGNKWDGKTQDEPAKPSKSAKSSAEKKAAKANDIKLPAWKGNVTKHSSNKGADKDDGTGDEVKEASRQSATTMKHVKNPTAGEKKAAKDIKAGVAGYGDRIAMLKSAEKDGRLKESNRNFKHNVRFVNESLGFLLSEDEEGKAKAITAAGDMVNDYTSWMQRVGQYQTKTMIELADAIKADFGAAEAETFKQAVGPALSATLEVLTQQREAVSNAVAVLAGEATPDTAMGMEPGMDAGMPPTDGMDMAAPDEMNAPADEFGASDAAAGMGTTGREMRESKFARKLAESHSILSKLAK